MKKIDQSIFDSFYQELLNMTSYEIQKDQFLVKTLYGGNSKSIYLHKEDIKNKILFFKLFNDKDFQEEVNGFYFLDLVKNKPVNIMKNSLKGDSYLFDYNQLNIVKNENELASVAKNIFDYSLLNIPISELTVLDFAALVLKKPISNNKLINNLLNDPN